MKQEKINFSSKEKAEQFIECFGKEIFMKRGYSPVRSYYNERCQSWQVTSSYLNATDTYLDELKSRDVLRLPHNCTKLHKEKLVQKQLLFDVDTVILNVVECLREGSQFSAHLDRLDVLMSIARKMEGEDAHKNRISKFMIFVKDSCIDPKRLDAFEDYFQKKVRHFNSAPSKVYNEQKENVKKACSKLFSLVESIKKEIESGHSKSVPALVSRAEEMWNDLKKTDNILSYKRKQAKCDLLLCKQAC